MIPAAFPADARAALLDPAIVVPPLLWLASTASNDVTGARFIATRWERGLPEVEAGRAARDDAS